MENFRKKELPNPKKYNIIPPDMDYIYFENAEDYPLEPKNTGYSPVNAWWFAECAFLAYAHPGFARMAFKLAGFNGFKFFHGIGTECMVSWNRKVVIVAFRGTELKSRSVLHEIGTDLDTIPVPFELGGKVHRGFLKGLGEIWDGPDGLQSFLNKLIKEKAKRPLWITGHSLGGALAALCFARTPEARGLYLYGAPRIGDQDFLNLFKGRPIWRIENAQDPVPLVPPDIPAIKFNFGDIGSLRFITREGEVIERRPVFIHDDEKKKYLEAKKVLDGKIKEFYKLRKVDSRDVLNKINKQIKTTKEEWKNHMADFFKDFGLNADFHQPIFYATKLWNALLKE